MKNCFAQKLRFVYTFIFPVSFQAQDDVQSRMEHIESLEKELSNRNEVIEELRKEKQIKAEETVKAQTVILFSAQLYNFIPMFYNMV